MSPHFYFHLKDHLGSFMLSKQIFAILGLIGESQSQKNNIPTANLFVFIHQFVVLRENGFFWNIFLSTIFQIFVECFKTLKTISFINHWRLIWTNKINYLVRFVSFVILIVKFVNENNKKKIKQSSAHNVYCNVCLYRIDIIISLDHFVIEIYFLSFHLLHSERALTHQCESSMDALMIAPVNLSLATSK
jgi:hypothetical protein